MGLGPLLICWLGGAVLISLDGRRKSVLLLGLAVLSFVLAWDVWFLVFRERLDVVTGGWPRGVGIRLRTDESSYFLGAISAAVMTAAVGHECQRPRCYRLFPGLILLLTAALHGAFFTADLFNYYVFFELSVVTSIVLATQGFEARQLRGAFAYAAISLVGSLLFLFGVAGIYTSVGTLEFAEIHESLLASELTVRKVLPSAALLFVGLALKVGLFPFHGWLPVLYTRVQPVVAAVLSGALVNVAIVGFLRLGWGAFEPVRSVASFFIICTGAIAIVYGAFLAFCRTQLAEIVGYAAVMQAGYLVLLLGIGGAPGAVALIFVALAGAVDKTVIFLLMDSRGATRRTVMFIAAFSLAGFPLTTGFLAKLALFRAALEPRDWSTKVAVASLVFGTVLTIAAAIRLYRGAVAVEGGERPLPWVAGGVAACSVLAGSLGVSAVDWWHEAVIANLSFFANSPEAALGPTEPISEERTPF